MYLVSSCLAGINCRYNGSNNTKQTIVQMVKEGKAIPVCPEVLAGLPTPRTCCEITTDTDRNKKVIGKDGTDHTKEFREGAMKSLEIAKSLNIKKAILQSRSPSCGYRYIYDGNFSGNIVEGNGLTADLLLQNGIEVVTEEEFL